MLLARERSTKRRPCADCRRSMPKGDFILPARTRSVFVKGGRGAGGGVGLGEGSGDGAGAAGAQDARGASWATTEGTKTAASAATTQGTARMCLSPDVWRGAAAFAVGPAHRCHHSRPR